MIGLFGLGGCLDRMLEGPLVLASVPGTVHSISPLQDALVVASDEGIFEVDGEGGVRRIGEAAMAVTTHPKIVYRISPNEITIQYELIDGGSYKLFDEYKPFRDILAWYDSSILALVAAKESSMVLRFYPERIDENARAIVAGYFPGHATKLAFCGERKLCVLDEHRVWEAVDAGGELEFKPCSPPMAEVLGATVDAKDRLFVVGRLWDEKDVHLYRVDGEELVLSARFLEGIEDIHPGPGGLLPRENLYFAGGESGKILYVRPL